MLHFILLKDLVNERLAKQKLETNRMLLDRQNEELKAKLTDTEFNQQVKTKTAISNLESKIIRLEEHIETEVKYVLNYNNYNMNSILFSCQTYSVFINDLFNL